jgi:hypothetical protein
MRALIIASLTLLSATACAEEREAVGRWEVDLRGARVVLGDARTTGGFMPQVAGRRAFAIAPWADVSVGAEVGVFGLGDEARWIGILGGPTVGASVRPASGPVALGLTVGGDFGRLPVCNAWGLCVRYVGFFPAFSAGATYYASKAFAAGASLSARPVITLAWQGASWEPSAHVRAFW